MEKFLEFEGNSSNREHPHHFVGVKKKSCKWENILINLFFLENSCICDGKYKIAVGSFCEMEIKIF